VPILDNVTWPAEHREPVLLHAVAIDQAGMHVGGTLLTAIMKRQGAE